MANKRPKDAPIVTTVDAGDILLLDGTAGVRSIEVPDFQTAITVADVSAIDTLTGAFTTDDSISTTSNVIRAQFAGHIYGLTLSNNVTDATNDIDIAAGEAVDGTNAILMKLASGITKRLDAAWAVGTGNGGRMSAAAITDTTYHVWLIQRSDTGVVDVGFDVSATAPTMPTDYDRKRRIGSIVRASAAIKLFWQDGDVFQWQTQTTDRSSTSAAAWALLTLTVPLGIKVVPLLTLFTKQNAAGSSDTAVGDARDSGKTSPVAMGAVAAASEIAYNYLAGGIYTNTSAQIYHELVITSGTLSFGVLQTRGYIDTRGRL